MKVAAGSERAERDAGDVGAYREVGQGSASLECRDPNCGDRETCDRVGDRYRAAGTTIAGNGDRAIIGPVSEAVGLQGGGQCQKQEQRQEFRRANC